MNEFQAQADRAAAGSKEVAAGVDQVVRQIETMRTGLDQAAAFLLAMQEDAAGSSMAGFNIPPEVLGTADFRAATKTFLSPNGHWARYLVFTGLDPFSPAAMDQVNDILDTARAAQPNTTLQDATITIGGYPAALRDTRDYYREGHPIHRRRDRRRRPDHPDDPAAGHRRTALSGWLRGDFILWCTRDRCSGVPVRAAPAAALDCAASGVCCAGRGRGRLQPVVRFAVA